MPRVYVSPPARAHSARSAANLAEIWLRDPRNLDEVLVQARATSYGLRGLRFVTRSGVRVLLDQAAGIVIDLLVALSLIALVTASVMLAASARAEVQRRLGAIGVRRAVGAPRGAPGARPGARGAACRGARRDARRDGRGARDRTARPTRLLELLNEPAARRRVAAAARRRLAVGVAIPARGAAWPAWRAAGATPVALLRGADVVAGGRAARGSRRGAPA